jgi:hypothetical protein
VHIEEVPLDFDSKKSESLVWFYTTIVFLLIYLYVLLTVCLSVFIAINSPTHSPVQLYTCALFCFYTNISSVTVCASLHVGLCITILHEISSNSKQTVNLCYKIECYL